MTTGNEEKFLHAVRYHWWMLHELRDRLARGPGSTDIVVWNAMVESFLIHGRILLDAFFKPPSGAPRGDDLTVEAIEGFERPALDDKLVPWRTSVNKRAAHLTNVAKELDWDLDSVVVAVQAQMVTFERHMLSRAEKGPGQ